MASVQELILAAQAKSKRSSLAPLLDLADSAMTGYSQGRDFADKRTDIALKLIQKQQLEQEIENQKHLREEYNKQQEAATQSELKTVGGEPTPVMPVQKLKVKWTEDAKGHLSKTTEAVDNTDESLIPREYYDPKIGAKRIGSYNSKTGKTIQSQDDPLAEAPGGGSSEKDQNKLYHQSVTNLRQFFSSRSGNFGTQDAKVNQALHLGSLADQYYNPATGKHDIPEAQSAELVMGLANLVSGSNVTTVEGLRSITPKNFAADTAHIVSYWTGKPITYQPEEMTKNILDSIDRQGAVAEDLRNTYLQQGKDAFVEPGLNESNTKRLLGLRVGSSYKDYLATRASSKKSSGGLTDAEKEELAALEAKYGGKK